MNLFRKLIQQRQIALLLLLSIVPVIGFGTFSYYTSLRLIEAEVKRTSDVAIAQMKEQVDQLLRQIEEVTGQFSLQAGMLQFVKIQEAPALGTLQAVNDIRRDLVNFTSSIHAVDSVYLYHRKQKLVLTSNTLFDLESFTDTSWMPTLQQAATERKSKLWITPRAMGREAGKSAEALTYVLPLPYFYEEPDAALIVNIKTSVITEMIRSFPFDSRGGLLVMSEAGQMIVQAGQLRLENPDSIGAMLTAGVAPEESRPVKLDTEAGIMYVTTERSSAYGFLYAMLIPADAASHNAQLLKIWIVAATAALSLLSLFVAYFNVRRFQSGLRRIFLTLRGKGEANAEDEPEPFDSDYAEGFARIENGIAALLKEMGDVRSQWSSQLPVLRDHFLMSALLGNKAGMDPWLRQKPAEMELFPDPMFSVLVAEMDETGETSRFSSGEDTRLFLFAVANISQELLRDKFATETVISRQHVAVILNMPQHEADRETVRAAESIRYAVSSYLKQTVTIAVGRSITDFRELSSSYQDALYALQENWPKVGNEVVRGGRELETAVSVPYPAECESALLAAIREGDRGQAVQELNTFFDGLSGSRLPFALIKTYAMQLLVSVIRLLQEYDPDLTQTFPGRSLYAEFAQLNGSLAMCDWFSETVLRPGIDFLNGLKRLRMETIMERTKKLIEERYAQDLSLQLAADQLGLSPSYLSELIKQHWGETFITYVTRFRIDKAKSLLLKTELNIADIAAEIGYGNATHLIRVFKKSEGMTPGEYRLRSRS
ncbi:helix-turn-helix domain-containing protein [Paenibacillus qinlingensis]|uniref:helix-turn-helix domain-containing protein n=1 Tax=Paenibacillus qinlingensis TaxID=1837343 RepID=UPI001564B8C5|nr:helix-turn-helix domain-containing protein [Paenibacillus qinlingensis]NQX60529.1 helix-turn-helix domain-containing protein [Paenibacillus qinlingensis]